MIKVLVVDDEQPVLDGIKVLIERYLPDLILAGTARNAHDAVERATSIRPDIVMMDVRLPGVSGLEALGEIRRFLPDAVFILVTAYERFDIALEAFQLGVQDYLLKPVTREKLLNALGRAVSTVKERWSRISPSVNQQDLLNECYALLEPRFFQMASQAALLSEKELTQELSRLERIFKLHPGGGRMAGLRSGASLDLPWDTIRSIWQYKSRGLLYQDGQLGLLAWIPLPEANDPEQAESILRTVIQQASPNIQFEIVLSEVASLEQCGHAFQELSKKLLLEKDASREDYPWALEKALLEAVLYRDNKRTRQALDQFRYHPVVAHCQDYGAKWKIYHDLATVITHQLGQHDVVLSSTAFPEFSLHENPEEVFVTWLGKLGDHWQEQLPITLSPIVEKAKRFIDQEFGKSISLEDVAQAAGVTPQYLCRLFAETMHESFVDYLTKVRMQKARDFLREGMSIKEISLSLGYGDPNYFSRLFKKTMGMTPKEYVRT